MQRPATMAPSAAIDAETALQIGLSGMTERYGVQFVEKHQPFSAVLLHGEWLVVRTSDLHREAAKRQNDLGLGRLFSFRGGGGPEASISSENGRLLRVGLAR